MKRKVEANMWLTVEISLTDVVATNVTEGVGTLAEIHKAFPDASFRNTRILNDFRDRVDAGVASLEARFTLGYFALPDLIEGSFRWRIDHGLVTYLHIDAVGPDPDNVVPIPNDTTFPAGKWSTVEIDQ